MPDFQNRVVDHTAPSTGTARFKLRRLAHVMRVLSGAYVAWVLYQIVFWWTDANAVQKNMASFLKVDLSGLSISQRMTAMGLDLLAWALLLVAVVHCWKLLACLLKDQGFTELAARHLTRCAWWGMTCEAFSVVTHPLQSWVLTWHLPAVEQIFKWRFATSDWTAVILCMALLMFAYLFSWVLEVAEENRGFV
jgi:hypothetical protein